MKKVFITLSFFVCLFGLFSETKAQKQIEPQIQRDPVMEADANKNLEAARLYFKTKKAYKAVLMRLEETIAASPTYSKMDEVLYLAGMSSYYLSEGKGKQKVKDSPEKLREDAVAYLSQLVENFPNSNFKSDAEKTLKLLEPKK